MIGYGLVQLSRPFIEKVLTELNVNYGVESEFEIFDPRSQFVHLDCDTRVRLHPAGDERPL